MHVPIFVLLAILTLPYWFPAVVFGYLAFALCYVAVALPYWAWRLWKHRNDKPAPWFKPVVNQRSIHG